MATKKAPKAVTTHTPVEPEKTPEVEIPDSVDFSEDPETAALIASEEADFANFVSVDGHLDPLTLEVTIAPIFEWAEGETGEEYQERCREVIHSLTRFVPAIDREVQRLQAEILYTQRELDAQEKRALNRVGG